MGRGSRFSPEAACARREPLVRAWKPLAFGPLHPTVTPAARLPASPAPSIDLPLLSGEAAG